MEVVDAIMEDEVPPVVHVVRRDAADLLSFADDAWKQISLLIIAVGGSIRKAAAAAAGVGTIAETIMRKAVIGSSFRNAITP